MAGPALFPLLDKPPLVGEVAVFVVSGATATCDGG